MKAFRYACLAAALCATAASASAMEITTHNDVRKLNNGLEQRLESSNAALTAIVNHIKQGIDDIIARIVSLESNMIGVVNKNTEQDTRLSTAETNINTIGTKQPSGWNTPLENRLKALETRTAALEAAPKGGLAYKRAVSVGGTGTQTSASYDHTICVLSRVVFGTTNDNHNHTCIINRSAAGFQLQSSGAKGTQSCTMLCYD